MHMTNTRMTDVEVLEAQYPVLVHEFGLRRSSSHETTGSITRGGDGKYQGGLGVRRELEDGPGERS